MSNFSDFLIQNYAPHFGVVWNAKTMFLRIESPKAVRFELEDKKQTIIQPPSHGISVMRRNANAVEIIDMEEFTKLIHGTSNTPCSCDFVISPEIGFDFIVLNELTKTESNYILPFRQPLTGIDQEGKLEYAKKQLLDTINRLYEVSNFCDQYTEKVALFSCRLSDKTKNGFMARSAKSFNKSVYMLQKLKLKTVLPHDFVFKMRVYDSEYRLS